MKICKQLVQYGQLPNKSYRSNKSRELNSKQILKIKINRWVNKNNKMLLQLINNPNNKKQEVKKTMWQIYQGMMNWLIYTIKKYQKISLSLNK